MKDFLNLIFRFFFCWSFLDLHFFVTRFSAATACLFFFSFFNFSHPLILLWFYWIQLILIVLQFFKNAVVQPKSARLSRFASHESIDWLIDLANTRLHCIIRSIDWLIDLYHFSTVSFDWLIDWFDLFKVRRKKILHVFGINETSNWRTRVEQSSLFSFSTNKIVKKKRMKNIQMQCQSGNRSLSRRSSPFRTLSSRYQHDNVAPVQQDPF